MFILPLAAWHDLALFSDGVSVHGLPSVGERRLQLIDAAAHSYEPLRDVFEGCLHHYGIDDFSDWMLTDRHAAAGAALASFFHPSVWPDAGPVDGTGAPVDPQDAKRNLLVWGSHQTIGAFTSFERELGVAKHPAAGATSARLAAYRVAVAQGGRPLDREDFSWPAQRAWFRNCIEGSNRSKTGKALENRARAVLKAMRAAGDLSFTMKDGEQQVMDSDGNIQRVDIVMQNSSSVLLIHMKSSQKQGQGYTGLYHRDTAGITAKLRGAFGASRSLDAATIYLGPGWNVSRLGAVADYLLDPGLPALEEDEQARRFAEMFVTWKKLDPFRIATGPKSSPPSSAKSLPLPSPRQADLFG